MEVLVGVLYLERSLRAEELCHVLGVERGFMDLDPGKPHGLTTSYHLV